MKLAIITLVTLASLTAQASVLTCRDTHGGPDHGMSVSLNTQTAEAAVSTMTIAGPRHLTTLECHFPEDQAPPMPDQIVPLASCYEKEMVDAGYSLSVNTGGIAGLTTATLYEVSFVGSKPVAKLICQR